MTPSSKAVHILGFLRATLPRHITRSLLYVLFGLQLPLDTKKDYSNIWPVSHRHVSSISVIFTTLSHAATFFSHEHSCTPLLHKYFVQPSSDVQQGSWNCPQEFRNPSLVFSDRVTLVPASILHPLRISMDINPILVIDKRYY